MNRLAKEKGLRVLLVLVEGNSIGSTTRISGVATQAVINSLRAVGQACKDYHDRTMINLQCNPIQAGEILSFCYAKDIVALLEKHQE